MSSAEIIRLDSMEEDNNREEFHNFLDTLKDDSKRIIILSVGKDNMVSVASSAKNPADLVIMLHHLKELNKYLVDTYAGFILNLAEEEDD